MNIPDTQKKRVVIIGGGFAGMALAKELDTKLFQVVLLDRNNYHQFQPLLYQVASSGLESGSISFPFRKLMRRGGVHFRLAEVTAIRTSENRVETSIGALHYDYLVIAAGTTTNFFGNEAIRRGAVPMKSMVEALELRNALLLNLEEALNHPEGPKRDALMNVVIVGGGATGVEIAGALSEMKRFIVPRDYPDLNASKMNIYLIEGTPKLLGAMSAQASAASERFLCEMGVRVMTGSLVTGYEDGVVQLNSGERIATGTLVWVSGVLGEHIEGIDPAVVGRGQRITVDNYNRIKDSENIFAVGDICLLPEEAYPNGHPQVAPAAIQQGKLLAHNLQAIVSGGELRAFHYRDRGTLATVGRNKAVADIAGLHLRGFTAWTVWMVVHLRSILGVRNKLAVLIDWVWNYFTYDRSLRFILFIPRRKA